MAKKIGILIENRFIEKEIFYYQSYFANKGFDVVLLTRLWGCDRLTFKGLEFQAEITAENSFENLSDEDLKDYAAIIAPPYPNEDRRDTVNGIPYFIPISCVKSMIKISRPCPKRLDNTISQTGMLSNSSIQE